jgi:hypothetical protein
MYMLEGSNQGLILALAELNMPDPLLCRNPLGILFFYCKINFLSRISWEYLLSRTRVHDLVNFGRLPMSKRP